MMNNLPVNGHRLWLASLCSSAHTLSNRDLFSSPASSITITVAVTVSVAIITGRRYLRSQMSQICKNIFNTFKICVQEKRMCKIFFK